MEFEEFQRLHSKKTGRKEGRSTVLRDIFRLLPANQRRTLRFTHYYKKASSERFTIRVDFRVECDVAGIETNGRQSRLTETVVLSGRPDG